MAQYTVEMTYTPDNSLISVVFPEEKPSNPEELEQVFSELSTILSEPVSVLSPADRQSTASCTQRLEIKTKS